MFSCTRRRNEIDNFIRAFVRSRARYVFFFPRTRARARRRNHTVSRVYDVVGYKRITDLAELIRHDINNAFT